MRALAGRGPRLIGAVDEAGRGALAGPVVAAAVVVEDLEAPAGCPDSKKLTPAEREAWRARVQAEALAWAIGRAEVEEIARLNILGATMAAMRRAVARLARRPELVFVDGNRAPDFGAPAYAVVRGDDLAASIGAASVLAKCARDDMMRALDARHPGYGFAAHKGYPTPAHRRALARLGPCAAHRRSFRPVRELADARRGA